MIGVLMVIAAWRGLESTGQAHSQRPLQTTVNPNTAPWWELTLLPRIGETMARRIVDYRESGGPAARDPDTTPAFGRVEDLLAVRGIGPKTVQRIRRHVRLGNP